MDVIESLQGFVGENLSLLAPVDQAWQPTDFLPDLRSKDWVEQLAAFRQSAERLSDELLVVLVGNMVTEEALPNYTLPLSRIARDDTGTADEPWAKWLRGWTAEENRHGDLLNAYLRLTGRVNMRAVERTIHHLLKNGFNPRSKDDGYSGLIYAAFQERATRITHMNVGKLAAAQGDEKLSKICRRIAGDEARHETFYTRVVGEIMERDPEGGTLAYRAVLKGLIAMPGRLMGDGKDPDLYDHFATVTQRVGAYTVRDYAQIIEHLNQSWGVTHRSLTGQAARAQDYLCRQPERYEHAADGIAERINQAPPTPYTWIDGRTT
ncbi:acyl-ACP desaturase [Singulisphaera acidiphila]|nr:acyl-ACP desaturase [Singulisphaera acidiphila]